MDYSALSLVDLKKVAKDRKIKQYYVKKRDELITLLRMETLPFKYTLEKMTIAELREKAKERGLRGFWSLHRDDLLKLLFPDPVEQTTPNKQDQNQARENKHENPESHNAKDVRV